MRILGKCVTGYYKYYYY